MKETIQCQEEVSSDKHSPYKSSTKKRPEAIAKFDEKTHQCKYQAHYLIKHIELYVCKTHASGIDKSQLTKLK